MHPFFVWLEATSLSTWIRESTSVWAFPTILSVHTVGMGFVAGLNAAVAFRILGFAPAVPLLELMTFPARHVDGIFGPTRCPACCLS